ELDPGPITPDQRAFAIPLRAAGQVIGWVHVGEAGAVLGPKRSIAESLLARMVSMADDDCENLIELRHRLKELAALSRLSALLAAARAFGWVHGGEAGAVLVPKRAIAESLLARMVPMADDDCENLIELRHRLKELAALSRLSALLAEADGLEKILDITLESALDLLHLSAGAIVLLKARSEEHTSELQSRE